MDGWIKSSIINFVFQNFLFTIQACFHFYTINGFTEEPKSFSTTDA